MTTPRHHPKSSDPRWDPWIQDEVDVLYVVSRCLV